MEILFHLVIFLLVLFFSKINYFLLFIFSQHSLFFCTYKLFFFLHVFFGFCISTKQLSNTKKSRNFLFKSFLLHFFVNSLAWSLSILFATHCNTLQHTATHCNTLQHIATHCNTLQHIATRCHTQQHATTRRSALRNTGTHCNTLQHIATHCNTLQHTGKHCNTLPHIATHCNTLQQTATHWETLQHNATHCNTLQHIATHCNTLQHTGKHCNTLGITATHWETLQHTHIATHCNTSQHIGGLLFFSGHFSHHTVSFSENKKRPEILYSLHVVTYKRAQKSVALSRRWFLFGEKVVWLHLLAKKK